MSTPELESHLGSDYIVRTPVVLTPNVHRDESDLVGGSPARSTLLYRMPLPRTARSSLLIYPLTDKSMYAADRFPFI